MYHKRASADRLFDRRPAPPFGGKTGGPVA